MNSEKRIGKDESGIVAMGETTKSQGIAQRKRTGETEIDKDRSEEKRTALAVVAEIKKEKRNNCDSQKTNRLLKQLQTSMLTKD